MSSHCPTCKRKLPVPKITGTREQDEDTAKAQYALTCLVYAASWPGEHISFYRAILAEAERLTKAIKEPRLLWSIYWKSCKGKPYYQAEVVEGVAEVGV